MSIQAVACAIALQGVSSTEKLLMICLANYADAGMRCYPSHSTLAEDSSLSERTILRTLQALEDRKLVCRHERRRQDGSRSTDMIVLHFAGEIVANGGDTMSPPPDTMAVGVGTLTVRGGDMVSPLTTFEPRTNHQDMNQTRAREPAAILPMLSEVQSDDYPPGAFESWYGHYPHKVGKDAARKAFEAVHKAHRASYTDLVIGLERYIASRPLDRAWCNPATWLNQGRWADQPSGHAANPQPSRRVGFV